jgi:hypothetical protein
MDVLDFLRKRLKLKNVRLSPQQTRDGLKYVILYDLILPKKLFDKPIIKQLFFGLQNCFDDKLNDLFYLEELSDIKDFISKYKGYNVSYWDLTPAPAIHIYDFPKDELELEIEMASL